MDGSDSFEEDDYEDIEKIVAHLNGEKYFKKMMSEFKKVIQEVKKDNKCVKKIVIPIESYFTESIHDPNGTPRYFFMPVSQSFYNK